jgi:hypothetical protein
MRHDDDPFDLERLRLPSEQAQTATRTPHRIAKRREHFIRVPFGWLERLKGASGRDCLLALHLLYLHWQNKGKPFKLPNGMLKADGRSIAPLRAWSGEGWSQWNAASGGRRSSG